eukprot:m.6259 g.6259  ORF g.6259 m.6259 type:complete len:419 (-) comp2081_c0_seq1:139-1395(-)
MASDLADTERLYRLIISQLRMDGHEGIAATLAKAALPAAPVIGPSSRLLHLVSLGAQAETQGLPADDEQFATDYIIGAAPSKSLDFDAPQEGDLTPHESIPWDLTYVSTHKAAVRTCAYSADGGLFATGGADGSVRVFNTNRAAKSRDIGGGDTRALVRQFAEHTLAINEVAFHPNSPVIATASKDNSIRLTDFGSQTATKSFKIIQDAFNVRTLCFHPGGDYLLAGTEHPLVRLYDTRTSQCFTPANPFEHHSAAITSVRYAPDARQFASGCKGGLVKLWDAVGNRCTATFNAAHGGLAVSSVRFSANGKYLLTTGKDSVVRLWDLRTGRTLMQYEGAVQKATRTQAVFSHSEDLVLCGNELTMAVMLWDARTGVPQKPVPGHAGPIRALDHSPVENGFLTGSDDKRARLFGPPPSA